MLSYVAGALVVIFFFIVLYGEFGPLTERQYYAPIKMGKYSRLSLSTINDTANSPSKPLLYVFI